MTAKQVININFSEIGKVEITCLKCGAGLILPVPQANVAAFMPPKHYECLGCKEVLWSGDNDQRLIRLVGLVRSLGYWHELKDLGFSLSFSINSN
jgi:uncharacterized protein with PIN domain